jgi:2-polyprenyl-3-methyl-5-hydroxy-6-metoxy-1,4-benzoquinol methylase
MGQLLFMKCYLCKNTVSKFLFKNNYQLFRCNSCGLLFYDFTKDYAKFLEKQYSKGYFTGESSLKSYTDYGKDKKNIFRNMAWLVNEIKKYKSKGKYLDVGCAYGYAMEVADKKGFDVYGIDPSDHAVSQAKKKFPKRASVSYLSNMKFADNSFDVISLFDVFEHLQDPRRDLAKLKKVLKNDGLVVIATGDTGSKWAQFSGRRWTFYNPPQHIFYFNRKNITRVLNESGFEVIDITTTGKWLSLPYIFHLAETVGENKLAKFLSPLVTNTPLSHLALYLKLHDNMVVFAKKR